MKKFFLLSSISVFLGLISLVFYANQAYAQVPFGGLPVCIQGLNLCNSDLDICDADLVACEGTQPDGFVDNGDGTVTDVRSGLMWEKKDNSGGVHDVDNTYTWTAGTTASDGTLFTVFLTTLNNTCRDDETVDCTTNGDDDCAGVGGACGFAGYRDWEIPNVKLLQSIVDYSVESPSSSFLGDTASLYWASTTIAGLASSAWVVNFGFFGGAGNSFFKGGDNFARAVRPCS